MIRIAALLALLFLAQPVNADELRPGYIEFSQSSGSEWILVWKSPTNGGFTRDTRPVIPAGCALSGAPMQIVKRGSVVATSRVSCPTDVAGKYIGLENFGTSQSDVLVRVAPLGRPVQVFRLTSDETHGVIRAKPGRWQVAQSYFVTGVDHILFGFDHLLFVVALVLLLSGFWTIVKAVTAFTVAHSVTLVATTFGLIGLPQRPVEIVIALSIMFLAVEIVKRRPGEARLSERIPWVVAFAFGLLHGFGFAGALKEIGLPENDVPIALVTFNLGVEAGQLAVVAATAAALAAIRHQTLVPREEIVKGIAYAIGTIASFWFIERMLG